MSDEVVIQRLRKLIGEGQYLAAVLNRPEVTDIELGRFTGWNASVLTFLRDFLPPNHTYLEEFQKTINEEDLIMSNVDGGVNILERLLDDMSSGYMVQLKTLVTAEVFADFIEMSRHLYKKKFYIPAVSVITAVLEDGLRRFAANKGITVGKDDTLGPLNDTCAKEGVYSKIEHNMIDKFRIIRNYVDHGQFEDFDNNVRKKDIEAMINDIERILATYLK
jgi:hypothetical protein